MVRSFAVGVVAALALVASGARAEDEKAAEGSGSGAEMKPSETTGAKQPELKGKKRPSKKGKRKAHKPEAAKEEGAKEKPAEDATTPPPAEKPAD